MCLSHTNTFNLEDLAIQQYQTDTNKVLIIFDQNCNGSGVITNK